MCFQNELAPSLEEIFLVLVVVVKEVVEESLEFVEVVLKVKSTLFLFVEIEEIVEILFSVVEVVLGVKLEFFVKVFFVLVEIVEEVKEVLLLGEEEVIVVKEVLLVLVEEVIEVIEEIL